MRQSFRLYVIHVNIPTPVKVHLLDHMFWVIMRGKQKRPFFPSDTSSFLSWGRTTGPVGPVSLGPTGSFRTSLTDPRPLMVMVLDRSQSKNRNLYSSGPFPRTTWRSDFHEREGVDKPYRNGTSATRRKSLWFPFHEITYKTFVGYLIVLDHKRILKFRFRSVPRRTGFVTKLTNS